MDEKQMVEYLREHSGDGIMALSRALGRHRDTVRRIAVAHGIEITNLQGRNCAHSKLMEKLRAEQAERDAKWGDYLRAHSGDGVKALEKAMGMQWRTIQNMAKRCGIRLKRKPVVFRRHSVKKEGTGVSVGRCSSCGCMSDTGHCIYGFSLRSDKCIEYRQPKL